jgi:hypothetical protein
LFFPSRVQGHGLHGKNSEVFRALSFGSKEATLPARSLMGDILRALQTCEQVDHG